VAFLFSNLRVKLLALALATALWSVVAYTQNPTQTRTYSLNIVAPNLPADLLILGDLKPVKATVVGPADSLKNFDSRSLKVVADFSSVKVGRNRVPMDVTAPDSTVKILHDDAIVVDVDQAASVEQTVKLERVHGLPPGFHEVASATTITPDKVVIQGPKSLLNGIEAVIYIDLEGLQSPIPGNQLTIQVRDANKKPLSKMTVRPPTVELKMSIQADAVTETKAAGFTVTGQPATGYRVTNIQVTPVFVNATGLVATLAGLQQVAADPVDITNARADVVKTVILRPPPGVDVSPKTVQVRVFISVIPGVTPPPPQP
jgi:hypothetical protein